MRCVPLLARAHLSDSKIASMKRTGASVGRFRAGLVTPLFAAAEISIIPAISGG